MDNSPIEDYPKSIKERKLTLTRIIVNVILFLTRKVVKMTNISFKGENNAAYKSFKRTSSQTRS